MVTLSTSLLFNFSSFSIDRTLNFLKPLFMTWSSLIFRTAVNEMFLPCFVCILNRCKTKGTIHTIGWSRTAFRTTGPSRHLRPSDRQTWKKIIERDRWIESDIEVEIERGNIKVKRENWQTNEDKRTERGEDRKREEQTDIYRCRHLWRHTIQNFLSDHTHLGDAPAYQPLLLLEHKLDMELGGRNPKKGWDRSRRVNDNAWTHRLRNSQLIHTV